MSRNTLGLLFLEWTIWVFILPPVILFFISLSTGDSFIELVQSIMPNGKNSNIFILYLIIVGLGLAPILSYYGLLTRPILMNKKNYTDFENEKQEIIDIIHKSIYNKKD